MIAALAQRQIERLVNRALERNPAARARLAGLGDLDIVLRAIRPHVPVTMRIRAGTITLEPAGMPESAGGAILEIAGSPPALLRIALDGSAPLPAAVSVTGDTELFAELRAIQAGLALDWEGELAAHVGDLPAHLLGLGARGALRAGDDALLRARELLINYLAEEAPAAPDPLQRIAHAGARTALACADWLGASPFRAER